MNRFTAKLDELNTLPSNTDARFWYRMAIMDIRLALGTEVSDEQWPLMKELHDALQKRYNEARS
jgi:hypothetical protein|tara:strand:- start:356 stop:547 length:192 start_codon:yes stop_codon:yes gene_type:complete